ncbi:MAG: DNA polymerase I [Candidatus Omnitrophica bacterium]|nr:DNA polymerase I [Candidatus Omnitrophota bacterium]
MKKKAFLFDGNSFCYRGFYAIKHLSNSKGEPTNAIYGFLTMLKKILVAERPDYVAICFDSKELTFRHKQYEEYKSHRKPMPDDLAVQIPRIKELIQAYNIKIFEKGGYEADDLLGTLATKFKAAGMDAYIVTGDKDFLQLVDNHIKVYSMYRDKVTIYGREKVQERYSGLGPEHITDIFGLMGDASDNIPGVPGIGEKTAVSFIKEFGSLQSLLSHIGEIKNISKRDLLKENTKQALLSKELATIDCNVPIKITIDELACQDPNREKLYELFKDLEFRKFLDEVAGKADSVKEEKRIYHVIETEKQLLTFIKKLSKVKAVALDTETTSKDPLRANLVGFSFSFKKLEAYYIVLSHATIATEKGIPLDTVINGLKPFLEDKRIKKYGQNIKYEKILLSRYGIILEGVAFDTMIAAYLINPAKFNHNLDSIALEYLDVQKITYASLVGSGKKATTIDHVDINRVTEYACEDADCVFRLVPLLAEELKKKKVESLFYNVEMPLVNVLTQMEINGVKIDVVLLQKLSKNAGKRLEQLTKKIYTEAGEEFNINSPKQLSHILFEKLQFPVIKKTKTGYSTDVSVLETLSEKHVLARDLLEYREYAKLKSTYLDALPELIHPETGMIHTSFNQTVTSTGRLSSSEPNLQNIPIKTDIGREIRKAFIGRKKERVILSADYSQIELRLLAHFSEDEKLTCAFCHDEDIHTVTATLLYNAQTQDVTSEMRHLAKVVNFSIIYGKTPYGLSRDLGIPVSEAKSFIDAYFERYKKIKIYLESLKEEARTKGYVTTILGRRAYFPDINSNNATIRQFAERAAMNAPLQGSAADLVKRAMIDIDNAAEMKRLDAVMILQVHDELLFDVAKEAVDDVKAVVKKKMETALALKVPLKVDITTGKSWYK